MFLAHLNHHLGILWLFFLPKIQTNVNDEQLSTWFWIDYLQIITKDVNSFGSIRKGLPFSWVCFSVRFYWFYHGVHDHQTTNIWGNMFYFFLPPPYKQI